MKRLALVLLVAAAPLGAQGGDVPPAERSAAKHPAYTEDQANQGERAFKMHCASCHELSFHTGEQFRMNWFSRTVFDLFKIIKTTMPEDNIGGLTDDEYTRVIAYIFKLNGFPAGADSLRSDSLELKRIRIGPHPAAADSGKTRR
jgi:mono/diheme cytochrome c family protein